MANKTTTPAQDHQSMAGRGDKFKDTRGPEMKAAVGGDTSKTTLEATTDSLREQADRQAIERGEDDGMIVNQSAVPSAPNRRDLNAISGR